MKLEDIKIYLPKYLSAESEKKLFEGLKDFPGNIDEGLYTNFLKNTFVVYQGDGIKNMPVYHYPKKESKPIPSIIFSNTCDIDPENKRNFPSQIVYAPIFDLEKYRAALLKNSSKKPTQINDHITAIKNQEVTQIFYLPQYGNLKDSIVFLDRVFNCPNNYIEQQHLKTTRIFSLSDYGIYLFVMKLSIHFTRIQDKVERGSFKK